MNDYLINTNQARKWYGNVKNATGDSIADHCVDVGNNLLNIFQEFSEISESKKMTLYRSALGHDLLEDADVEIDEIRVKWGAEVVEIIDGLTNKRGDSDFSNYLQKLSKASDEITIVKLADILSNVNNSIKRTKEIDPEWVRSFWIPLLDKYIAIYQDRDWNKYPKSGLKLKNLVFGRINILKDLYLI